MISVTLQLQPRRQGDRVLVEGIIEVDGERRPFAGWMALLGLLEEHVENLA